MQNWHDFSDEEHEFLFNALLLYLCIFALFSSWCYFGGNVCKFLIELFAVQMRSQDPETSLPRPQSQG